MKIKYLLGFYILIGGLLFPAVSCVNAQEKPDDQPNVKTTETSKNADSAKIENVSEPESFALGKVDFDLTEREGECIVSYEKNGKTIEVKLEIPPPCRVVRDNKDNARYVTYKDIKSDVFMIVGDVKDMGGKPCGTKAQVVLLKRNSATAGKTLEGTVCVLYGTDEKDFWMLSH